MHKSDDVFFFVLFLFFFTSKSLLLLHWNSHVNKVTLLAFSLRISSSLLLSYPVLALAASPRSCVCTCAPPSGSVPGLRTGRPCSGSESACHRVSTRPPRSSAWACTSRSPRP